jgi:aminopeptidase-like protein
LIQIQDISFTLPVRKKLTVEFTTTHIKVLDNKTKELIPGASSYAWKDIGISIATRVYFPHEWSANV